MNYTIEVTGCYEDIQGFVSDFESGGYDYFRDKGRVLELMRVIFDNVSFTNGVKRIAIKNNNTCIISGSIRSQNVGLDIAAFLGMSEKYYALNLAVRCFSPESKSMYGVNIRGGYFDNPYHFDGESDIVSVFFTYMCQVKFSKLDKGLIRSDKGHLGSYHLISRRQCLASGSTQMTYNFTLNDGVFFELEYRVTRNGDKQTFNVYSPENKNENKNSTLVLSSFLMANVRVETLAKMKNNRVAQVRRV
ncbi:hypothetical protein LMH73_026800 [Vibrio splendidus]|nr:hypothetical protein [Vibrio splendidus]MCC4881482.1 hypothetical protein [Vibrio splendidus]